MTPAVSYSAAIGALPLQYAFSVRLPANILADFPPGFVIHINERMMIRNVGGHRDNELPLTTGNQQYDAAVFNRTLLTADLADTWKGAVLEIIDDGYVTKGVTTSPRLRAVEAAHAVFGLAMIFGLLHRQNQYAWMPTAPYYVHMLLPDQRAVPVDKGGLSQAAASLASDLTGSVINIDEPSKPPKTCSASERSLKVRRPRPAECASRSAGSGALQQAGGRHFC